MEHVIDASAGPPEPAEVLGTIGYLGHFLRMHSGGRGGKQFVLISLDSNGGRLAQKELFERSCTSSASLSEVLAKLEAEGLVKRTQKRDDRRQLEVELTEEGALRARTLTEERRRFEEEALSCLGEDDVGRLKELLDTVATHWRHLEEREVSA